MSFSCMPSNPGDLLGLLIIIDSGSSIVIEGKKSEAELKKETEKKLRLFLALPERDAKYRLNRLAVPRGLCPRILSYDLPCEREETPRR